APRRLGVDLVGDDLLGVPGRQLGRVEVGLVDRRNRLGVVEEQLRHGGGDDIGGVAQRPVDLVVVEVGRDLVQRPAQRAAVGHLVPGRLVDVERGGRGAVLAEAGTAVAARLVLLAAPAAAGQGRQGQHEGGRGGRDALAGHGSSWFYRTVFT